MKLFNYKGFFLFELNLYLVLLLLMTVLLGQWVGVVFRSTQALISHTIMMQDAVAMHDLFKADIMHAPADVQRWQYTDMSVRWRQYDAKSIEWSLENGVCIRKEGIRSNDNEEWSSVQKSIVGEGFIKGGFHVLVGKNDHLQKIDFLFQTSLHEYAFTYYL